MLVVGGNRQIATGDNNGMIGGHAQRVPGAAGATQAIPPTRYSLNGSYRWSCWRENQSASRQRPEHLLLYGLPCGYRTRLYLEHTTR